MVVSKAYRVEAVYGKSCEHCQQPNLGVGARNELSGGPAGAKIAEMDRRRIAVLGLYRSGSTVVAGVLHHLGVDMGAPFYGGYYESDWLSKQLRIWWDEPRLQEKVPQAERVRVLTEWIQQREEAGVRWVGMKHPLLSLCGEDLIKAWGEQTRFIRCCRPLAESVESMKRGLGYTGDAELLQGTLLNALDAFLTGREHLQIHFSDMMHHAERELRHIIDFLEITPNKENIAAALGYVKPGARAKVEVERQEGRPVWKRFSPKRLLRALGKTDANRKHRKPGHEQTEKHPTYLPARPNRSR